VGRRYGTRSGRSGSSRERVRRAASPPVGGGSVSRTRPQTAEQVDAAADGKNYEEDLHWEALSAASNHTSPSLPTKVIAITTATPTMPQDHGRSSARRCSAACTPPTLCPPACRRHECDSTGSEPLAERRRLVLEADRGRKQKVVLPVDVNAGTVRHIGELAAQRDRVGHALQEDPGGDRFAPRRLRPIQRHHRPASGRSVGATGASSRWTRLGTTGRRHPRRQRSLGAPQDSDPSPASSSASGTSSRATAARSTPPSKAVMGAATRPGHVIQAATKRPSSGLRRPRVPIRPRGRDGSRALSDGVTAGGSCGR
jgi:hypothetical protein